MKNLTWWQADQLARAGTPVRRVAWDINPIRWITYETGLFYLEEQKNLLLGDEEVVPVEPAPKRVVRDDDFGYNEFLALDWTNEPPINTGPDAAVPPSSILTSVSTGLSDILIGGAMLKSGRALPRPPEAKTSKNHPRLGEIQQPVVPVLNFTSAIDGFSENIEQFEWAGSARWELSQSVMYVDEIPRVFYNELGMAFMGRIWLVGAIAQFYTSARYRTSQTRPFKWVPWRVATSIQLTGTIIKTMEDLVVNGVTGIPVAEELLSGWGMVSGIPVTADTRNPLPAGVIRVPNINNISGLKMDWSFAASAELVPELGEVAIEGSGLAITNESSLPPASVGQPYSQTLTATGGVEPYTWTIVSGAPPQGITLSSAGVLSGTPIAAISTGFTVRVIDSDGNTVTKMFTLSAGILISPITLPWGSVNFPYFRQLSATGGTTPYTWAIASGALPPGLHLTSAGAISGFPTVSLAAAFVVRATDSAGRTGTRNYTLTIS
ncbi:MAG: Ig domain-containing protein [Chthoniobacteraceae bacterium]